MRVYIPLSLNSVVHELLSLSCSERLIMSVHSSLASPVLAAVVKIIRYVHPNLLLQLKLESQQERST